MPRPPVNQPPPTGPTRVQDILDQRQRLASVGRHPDGSSSASAVDRLRPMVADFAPVTPNSLHRRQ